MIQRDSDIRSQFMDQVSSIACGAFHNDADDEDSNGFWSRSRDTRVTRQLVKELVQILKSQLTEAIGVLKSTQAPAGYNQLLSRELTQTLVSQMSVASRCMDRQFIKELLDDNKRFHVLMDNDWSAQAEIEIIGERCQAWVHIILRHINEKNELFKFFSQTLQMRLREDNWQLLTYNLNYQHP